MPIGKRRGFGQRRRLPSRRWQAGYTGPDGALHYAPRTFDTAEDAEAWLTDERRLITASAWTSPAARAQAARDADQRRREATFGAYALAWLDRRHDLRPTTRAS